MSRGASLPERPARLGPAELLDAVPVANEAARRVERGKVVTLYLPIQRRWWTCPPFSWLLPYRKERGFQLDALGREVFEACDGRRTMEQIIDEFAQRHRLRFHDARLAVMQFIKTLVQRRLVAVVVRESAPDAASDSNSNTVRSKGALA